MKRVGQQTPGADRLEDETAHLLAMAGARPAVPHDRADRVRATVHAEWRASIRRRKIRRGLIGAGLSAAAVLALITGRAFFIPGRGNAPAGLVATVEQIEGTPRRAADPAVAHAPGGLLAVNDPIRAGEWIVTDGRARIALRFVDGASVRLDVLSRARPLSSGALELQAGAVYVDTGHESGRFVVHTPVATARDVGTQFEVRLLERALRLRVRTGIVELRDESQVVTGRAGTELILSSSGTDSRSIAVYGSEWNWTTRVSPGMDIEGMAVHDYLTYLAREHGWALHYADPELAREAATIILHGSVRGLSPQEALAVAITTSGLRHRLERGELVVLRAAGEA